MKVGEGATVCRWLEPTPRAVRYLRRFAPSDDPPHRHDLSIETGIVRVPVGLDATLPATPQHRKPNDPPWPLACTCGYRFTVRDLRQIHLSRLYADPATGEEFTLSWRWEDDPRSAPAGAMWDAKWMPAAYRGPDGRALTVRCPNGMDWSVDGPASRSGGRWTRTGDPGRPGTLSVTPSIAIGVPAEPDYYHGFLGSNGTPPGHLSAHIG